MADLIKDLSSKLRDIAGEFNSRVDRIVALQRPADPRAERAIDLIHGAREMLADRKARRRHFPVDLFHEPAWDMLIALFLIHDTDHSMNVKALVACSDAPATTSQRWIDYLHKVGLVDRVTDMNDRRRIDISLSAKGHAAMIRYLHDVSGSADL